MLCRYILIFIGSLSTVLVLHSISFHTIFFYYNFWLGPKKNEVSENWKRGKGSSVSLELPHLSDITSPAPYNPIWNIHLRPPRWGPSLCFHLGIPLRLLCILILKWKSKSNKVLPSCKSVEGHLSNWSFTPSPSWSSEGGGPSSPSSPSSVGPPLPPSSVGPPLPPSSVGPPSSVVPPASFGMERFSH